MLSDRQKIKNLAITGFFVLVLGFASSGAVVYYFLEKHLQIEAVGAAYEKTQQALLALTDSTEKLKTSNRLQKVHATWWEAAKNLQTKMTELTHTLPLTQNRTHPLLSEEQNIQTEVKKIHKLLQTPLYTDEMQTIDEPILKRFGMLSVLEHDSFAYYELNAIINALELLTELEAKMMTQLDQLIETNNQQQQLKLAEVRRMSILFPALILLTSLAVATGIFIWMSRTEKELFKTHMELKKLNTHLQKEVDEKVAEMRRKDELLIQQSKQVAMGEMISNIAHQWRQPITSIGNAIQMLEEVQQEGGLTSGYVRRFIEKNMQLIKYISNTIDDLRNFFAPDREKKTFSLSHIIDSIKKLIEKQLSQEEIVLQTEGVEDKILEGYENALKQVLLILINNAQDAILTSRKEKETVVGVITVKTSTKDGKVHIHIEDNGNGIDPQIIDRIFEPYFTTKFKSQGTGIGLYMAKTIVERHMQGTISAENTDSGACLTVTLPTHI